MGGCRCVLSSNKYCLFYMNVYMAIQIDGITLDLMGFFYVASFIVTYQGIF